MALIPCPACENQVSEQATKCPSCGHTLRVPKRGLFGKLFKWLFILFNILMAIWVFSYWGDVGDMMNNGMNDAQKAGASIGATMGTGMLFMFWVMGDIILGLFVLFTRPKR